MKATKIAVILACLLAAGCVSADDPTAVAKATSTSFNPHTGLRQTSGAVSSINGNLLEGVYTLRSFSDASGATVHQVYLSVSASGWMFLNAAYAYGRPLSFVAIDRSVSSCSRYGCTVNETVGVNLNMDDLRRFAASGFSFQLSGQRANRVVNIPATYFQGYLSQLPEQATASQQEQATSPGQQFPAAPKP